MSKIDRRDFIRSSATAAAAGTIALRAPSSLGNTPSSPNDTIRVAIIGVRGQGNAHIKTYSAMQNVAIAALCDVDESILNQRCAEIEAAGKPKPKTFTDLRQVLDDKSIDCVSIATPRLVAARAIAWVIAPMPPIAWPQLRFLPLTSPNA